MREDNFKRVFQNVIRFYDISGNQPPEGIISELFYQQVSAMHIDTTGHISLTAKNINNWGIATYPDFPGQPGVGFAAFPDMIHLTSLSKNRDAAFQVLTYLVSEEQQVWRASQLGLLPTLRNSGSIMEKFGPDLKGVENANISAVLPESYAQFYMTPYYSYSLGLLWDAPWRYLGGKDVNTLLREATELGDQYVEADLANK